MSRLISAQRLQPFITQRSPRTVRLRTNYGTASTQRRNLIRKLGGQRFRSGDTPSRRALRHDAAAAAFATAQTFDELRHRRPRPDAEAGTRR